MITRLRTRHISISTRESLILVISQTKAPGWLRSLIPSRAGLPATTALSSRDPQISSTISMSNTPTFTPFPRLPPEIRAAIWRAALPCDLHISEVRISNKTIVPNVSTYTAFRANRESRAEAFAALLRATPPRSDNKPYAETISIDQSAWNDLVRMDIGHMLICTSVCDTTLVRRFVASVLVDADGGRFGSVGIDMRLHSPNQTSVVPAGRPHEYLGWSMRINFILFAKLPNGGGLYVHSGDIEDGVVGFGGRRDQGPEKPVLRVIYVPP